MCNRTKRWTAAALTGAVAITVLAASYVVPTGIKQIDVREKRGSMYPVIGTLTTGQAADVVSESPDGWLIVRIDDKEGTVKKTAFDAPRGQLVAQSPGGQASAAEGAAAARGLSEEAIAYGTEKNLNPQPLQTLIANRQRVQGTPWVGFASAKNLGPFKK